MRRIEIMLSELDIIAFEQERTMPYKHSPYPEYKDPKQQVIEQVREEVAKLKAYLRENESV
jgi:transcription initiation factor IIE alpha subunit